VSYFNKLQAQHDEAVARASAILNLATEENRELSEDEQKQVDENIKLADDLQPKMAQAKKVEQRAAELLKDRGTFNSTGERLFKEPAKPKAHGKLKAFKNGQDAYDAGQFLMATIGGNSKSMQYCREKGLVLNVHSEGVNSAGGYLVPEVMESAIIDLKEQYGVARQNAFVYPMTSDATVIPRRQSGFTVYYVGENALGTESDLSWSQVRLEAKKAMILTRLSSELNEDSIVALADITASEMAYAFANAEDSAVFLGDSQSAYGGVTGLANSLLAGSVATAANGDNTFAELEWAFFEGAVAKLPQFPGLRAAWYVNSAMFYTAMARLANAAGGNTKADIASGYALQFMGLPVIFTQVLPSSTGDLASQVVGFVGDLSMCGTFGSRRGVTISSDTSRYFEYDQIALKATQRWTWNGHETGTATVAGPMIALKMGTA
jgi:HK97 family phage major capsid protein